MTSVSWGALAAKFFVVVVDEVNAKVVSRFCFLSPMDCEVSDTDPGSNSLLRTFKNAFNWMWSEEEITFLLLECKEYIYYQLPALTWISCSGNFKDIVHFPSFTNLVKIFWMLLFKSYLVPDLFCWVISSRKSFEESLFVFFPIARVLFTALLLTFGLAR